METAHTPRDRVRSYGLPLSVLLGLMHDIPTSQPRSLLADARAVLASLHEPPGISGLDQIPSSGPCLVVYNHYERPGLWIGFAGAMLIDCVARARGDESAVPLKMIVTDRALVRVRGRTVEFPMSRFFLRRVAALWGMILMSADAGATVQHGRALKEMFAAFKQGKAVALAPEGAVRGDRGLNPALPGTGALVARLNKNHVPVAPAGVWEDEGGLHVNWGVPIAVHSAEDEPARREVMQGIAALLPESVVVGERKLK